MITTTTKIQLLIFAIITVLGAAFVGGRYAEIDRLVIDRTYPVKVDFAESGGIFAGAEVTYRGLPIGKVKSLEFTQSGVEATLNIEKDAPKVPSDVLAVVANKSAIGEQYVDLQPRRSGGPYLDANSMITRTNTKVPLDTTRLLLDVGKLTNSVDVESLQTLVNEVGLAFAGYGQDLSVIIESFTSFLEAADQHFPQTQALIRGSSTVLETLVDKRGEFASFTEDLTKLTDTLVEEDDEIRDLVEDGPEAEKLVAAVLKENTSDLKSLFHSLSEVSAVGDKRWKSLEVLSIILPYLAEGGFTAIEPSLTRPGKWSGSIGLVFAPPSPVYQEQICATKFGDPGYRTIRPPTDLTTLPLNHYDCDNEDKVPMDADKVLYNFNRTATAPAGGKDSWKWLLLGTASN
jgi:phospholipid/cholesterol/gamma-HCH transport system substrate-binding protein